MSVSDQAVVQTPVKQGPSDMGFERLYDDESLRRPSVCSHHASACHTWASAQQADSVDLGNL